MPRHDACRIYRQYVLRVTAIRAGIQQSDEAFLRDPEEHLTVEEIEETSEVGSFEAKVVKLQRLLIANRDPLTLEIHEFYDVGSALAQQLAPDRWRDVAHLDQRRRRQQAPPSDGRPAPVGRHVEQLRMLGYEVVDVHRRSHRRRSMTLRASKRVTMSETGARLTF